MARIVAKIMENLLHKQLTQFYSNNNELTSLQHGSIYARLRYSRQFTAGLRPWTNVHQFIVIFIHFPRLLTQFLM